MPPFEMLYRIRSGGAMARRESGGEGWIIATASRFSLAPLRVSQQNASRVASLRGADECVRPYIGDVAPDAFVRGCAERNERCWVVRRKICEHESVDCKEIPRPAKKNAGSRDDGLRDNAKRGLSGWRILRRRKARALGMTACTGITFPALNVAHKRLLRDFPGR
jgi:hypothetical protein